MLNKIMLFLSAAAISTFVLAIYFTVTNDGKSKALDANIPKYAAISSKFDSTWAMNKHWDDGLAEVADYAATKTVYGKVRNFTYHYITVSEVFNKEFHTKSNNLTRPDLYQVMKLNAQADIPTENYTYHYLTSTFTLRNYPLIINKYTMGSQEWCGNTFKEYFLTDKGQLKLTGHSYFDEEGDKERYFNDAFLMEDQLPYVLRTLKFKAGNRFAFPLMSNQTSSSLGDPKPLQARFEISPDTALAQNAWKVSVKLDKDKTNNYWFATNYPNIMLKQTTWDDRNMTLISSVRKAYWKH